MTVEQPAIPTNRRARELVDGASRGVSGGTGLTGRTRTLPLCPTARGAHPGARRGAGDALRVDRSPVPGAVEEMPGRGSPTPYSRRAATEDTDSHGVTIGAEEKAAIRRSPGSRDESVFTAPSAFDVRRDPAPHLVFGASTHTCLGPAPAPAEPRVLPDGVLGRVARCEVTGEIPAAPRRPVELVPAN